MGFGGGGWWKFLVTEKILTQKTKFCLGGGGEIIFVPKKNILGGDFGEFGAPHAPPGGRAGSENDTLLPMTMTCDRLKFWNGPAWRSKIIIQKPWRRKNKK